MMNFVNVPASTRMSALSDLTRALHQSASPHKALLIYCKYLHDAHPERAHILLSTKDLEHGEYRIWRLMGDDGIEYLELRDPWTQPGQTYRGGIIGEIIAQTRPHWVNEIDWSRDPYFAENLRPYSSLIAVPLLNACPARASCQVFRWESMEFTPGPKNWSATA